jgi:nicotinamide mononucleotide transporter
MISMTTVEAIGTLLGLLCVVLYVRQNIWSWPVGLAQVLLFIIVFYEAKLYSDLVLHVIYVGMQIYGWHHWLRGGDQGASLPVTRLTRKSLGVWAAVATLGCVLWGLLMASYTDAAAPYPDAFIAATSLVAQWLITRKKLEAWWFWIAVDVAAIGVYLYKSLYFASALYLLFLGLAITGYRSWRKASLRDLGQESSHDLRPDTGQVCATSSGASTADRDRLERSRSARCHDLRRPGNDINPASSAIGLGSQALSPDQRD